MRAHFYAGLVALAFLNAVSEKVFRVSQEDGPVYAVLNTFGVSGIVWLAFAVVVHALWTMPDQPLSRADMGVAAAAAAMIVIPVPALASVALTLLAMQLWRSSASSRPGRSAAILLLALTVPLLWSRLVFAGFSDTLLGLDARMVAWMLGTHAYGNIVPFPDGSGTMFFAPGCSSFTNVSLAFLCTALFVHLNKLGWTGETWLWALSAVVAVVVINVLRISAIGLSPSHYELLHGPAGSAIFGWITVLVLVALGLHGVGRVRAA